MVFKSKLKNTYTFKSSYEKKNMLKIQSFVEKLLKVIVKKGFVLITCSDYVV